MLFEALEKSGLNASGADDASGSKKVQSSKAGMSGLFEGHLIDYIHCRSCGHTRQRRDRFMDAQLPIQGKSSLPEALADFVKPEILEGENQWWCDVCEAKVDADKGLAFDGGRNEDMTAGEKKEEQDAKGNGIESASASDDAADTADDVQPALPPLLMLSLNRLLLHIIEFRFSTTYNSSMLLLIT